MVRHGQSEDNVSKVFSRDDTKLTETGIKQIKNARELIRNYDFKTVYYSPLTRTNQTLEHLELEGIEEERIREVNFGKFAGLSYNELVEKYPDESKSWFADPHNYEVPGGGESLNMVYERIVDFLEFVIEKDEDIVLVTHEGIIKLICSWVFDNPNYFYNFKADNGSISIVSVEDDNKYIKKLNSSLL